MTKYKNKTLYRLIPKAIILKFPSSLMPRFAVETPQQLDWTSCSYQLIVYPLPPSGDDLKEPYKRVNFSVTLLQMPCHHCKTSACPLWMSPWPRISAHFCTRWTHLLGGWTCGFGASHYGCAPGLPDKDARQ